MRVLKVLSAVAVLAALLAPSATVAQDAPPEPKAEAKDNRTSTVDFEYDGLIFVQAKVNGAGPYKFLFDSGATQSVVNARLADELDLEQHEMPGGVQGVGTAEASLVILESVEIGGFKRGKSLAASMNFDHMSGTFGYHLMGIIGQNVIRPMEKVEIDFSTSKLSMTGYAAGEEPSNWQEDLIIAMLEGGGGNPGIPGLPQPKGGDKPEEQPAPKPKEEEFSTPAVPVHWLWQNAEPEEKAAPRRSPTEAMTLTYHTMGLLGFDLVTLWYVNVEINGKTRKFMFDTGANMLLVVESTLATELALPTSFSFPAKGIGTAEAKCAVLDSFSVGSVKETDIACVVMDLPKVSDQLGGLLGQLPIPGADKMIKQLVKNMDFEGIVGLPLATRFKRMELNTRTKQIKFVPYGKEEENRIEPFSTEDFVKEAAIRTWQGKAAKFGFAGDSVPLEDWTKLGVAKGGMKVESVEEGGAAAKAGIKPGDIITHLVGEAGDVPDDLEDADLDGNNVRVRDLPALIMWACTEEPGKEVTVRLKRGEETLELKVVLANYGWSGTAPNKYK